VPDINVPTNLLAYLQFNPVVSCKKHMYLLTIINSLLVCPVRSILHSIFLEMWMIGSQTSVKYGNFYTRTCAYVYM